MAATAEWVDIPFQLQSPYATIDLNEPTGDRYLLIPSGCDMGAGLRVAKDDIPQFDGSILHRRWFQGYECRLSMMLWYNDSPACNEDLVRMVDTLNGICWSLRAAGDNEGRLIWEPSGEDTRMLDDIKLFERLVFAAPDDGGATVASFAIDTAYPYAQDITEQMPNTLPNTLTNLGTAEYWPVFRVSGSNSFTITNVTTGLSIVFDSSLPGGIPIPGGSYVEIDTFRATAIINGDEDDALASINMPMTDFFSLIVGANDLTLSSGSATVLWTHAWA
jgi:hypothetical protein